MKSRFFFLCLFICYYELLGCCFGSFYQGRNIRSRLERMEFLIAFLSLAVPADRMGSWNTQPVGHTCLCHPASVCSLAFITCQHALSLVC